VSGGAASEELLVEDRDGVRVITWNRPDALNAMSMELWDGTRDALDGVAGADIGCVVLTGNGRAFNVGQDLAEFGHPGQADERRGLRGLMRALSQVEVPLVAAVNGMAVGFGATLLPWCEVVIVSEQARMKVPFLSLGVTTEAGSSASLPAVMGPQAAARFVLTGEWMPAGEMVACGLAWKVVPAEELLPCALELAATISGQPREATRTTTRLLRAGRRETWLAAADREYAEMGRLAGSEENLAAIEAFFNRA
jgi:enoyl-CoA hydratase/carnithine racemase